MSSSTSENLVLVLGQDNPSNTILIDKATGEHLFTVRTEHGDDAITKVLDADGKQLAQWVWREYRSDLLTFPSMYGEGTKGVSVSTWLRKSVVPFKHSVTFRDLKNRIWKWKGNSAGSNLQLFPATDKANPAASFKKYYKYKDPKTGAQVEDPASLTVTPAGAGILDMVVVSFLLLEKERRIGETSAVSMADSLAVPHAVDIGLPKA